MVESIPSFSGPTTGPGTAFLAPQPTTQAEKSVDSSVDFTAESLLLATTLSSMNRGFWRHHGGFCPRVNHQSNYFLFIVEYKVTISDSVA
ncbi:hypothetical protein NQZ68_003749 [Dissostichus eleginoides]|nr:hypothetical protein NQZ68_003749 [Dissostichus eleginoides]